MSYHFIRGIREHQGFCSESCLIAVFAYPLSKIRVKRKKHAKGYNTNCSDMCLFLFCAYTLLEYVVGFFIRLYVSPAFTTFFFCVLYKKYIP